MIAGVAVSKQGEARSRPYSPSSVERRGTPTQRGPCGLTVTTRVSSPSAVDGGAERIAGACAAYLDAYVQPAVAQLLGEPVTPLDDRDRVVGGRVEVDVVDLGRVAEPVGVDVHQRRTARPATDACGR